MRSAGTQRGIWLGALFACAAFGACTYDFDTLVAPTSSGGTAGSGSAGLGGQGGASGTAGSDDGGMEGGSSAGAGGAAGNAGAGGSGGTAVDAGRDGAAVDGAKGDAAGMRGDAGADTGNGGATSDTAADQRSDTITGFDCAAVSGTVYQGHCYYPSPTPISWDVAKTTACAAPAHLAVITTAGEQGVVAAILPGQERWIGLRKDPGPPNQEARFYWVTKEPVSFKMWDAYDTGPPEPNFTGDCVRMRPTNNWGDTVCTETYGAVCEYE
jgi:hypothetical protein